MRKSFLTDYLRTHVKEYHKELVNSADHDWLSDQHNRLHQEFDPALGHTHRWIKK